MDDTSSFLQPIVVDSGSGLIKAGFSGSDKPKCVYRSYVGRAKHKRTLIAEDRDLYNRAVVGSKAEENRGLLHLKYPIENGIVTDWDNMVKVWGHIYEKGALSDTTAIPSEEHPVLLTEAPLNPRKNREKAAEVFFETFNAPAMYISPQAILSLYSSGRTTGVVVDCGDGVTSAVPIYKGFALAHAITRSDYGGRDVTNRLQLLLRRGGYVFHTSAEKEIVRTMKEVHCYVALNPEREESLELQQHTTIQTYKLPDGTPVQLGPERFRAPELLFNPSLIGLEYASIPQVVHIAIQKSDMDLRSELYKSIVLAGGSTKFPGFGERLLNEVRKLGPRGRKIRIHAPPDRQFTTWAGGSILANLFSFKTMWLTRRNYQDHGSSLVYREDLS